MIKENNPICCLEENFEGRGICDVLFSVIFQDHCQDRARVFTRSNFSFSDAQKASIIQHPKWVHSMSQHCRGEFVWHHFALEGGYFTFRLAGKKTFQVMIDWWCKLMQKRKLETGRIWERRHKIRNDLTSADINESSKKLEINRRAIEEALEFQ